MNIRKIIYYLYICSVMFAMPFMVSAGNIGIAVDQTAIVFDVNAGESQNFIVNVKNISNERQEIEVDVMDYALGDDNAVKLLDNNDGNNGVKEWISPRDKNIVLEPGKVKEVVFDVNVPNNVSIGSHRGVALFRATSKDDDTVKVQGQIGVHTLINVKGDIHADGKINKFDIPLLTSGLINYVAEFENTGNIHYVPYGEVKVRNIFTKNEQLYVYDKHFVFPGKKFTFSNIKQIPSLFGLYKAQVTFVDGAGARHIKLDYVMGYFFPLVFIGIIGIIIVIARQVYKRRKINKKIDISQNEKE